MCVGGGGEGDKMCKFGHFLTLCEHYQINVLNVVAEMQGLR